MGHPGEVYNLTMSSLALTIKPGRPKKILLEMNADQFEKLAAQFGFFNPEFLKSMDKAEREYKAGKAKKVRSLGSLNFA